MSEPNQFQGGSNFNLGNSCATHGGGQFYSLRNVPPASAENPILVPPLPPRPDINTMNSQQQFGMTSQFPYGGMGSYGMGNYGGYGMGNYVGYGGYGNGYGMGGMGMGGMYGGYNRFGMNTPMYGDIETRFIQMAEERSRPAFDSIQSLVNAVGSIAMMLENTFFALTSSFRAILGVAENVGRLRSLFSQFWSTFAVITKLNWIVRKLLVMLGIRTESEFKAWAEAVAATQTGAPPGFDAPRASSWPVLLFFGVVAAAPYLVFKMLNSLTTSINEKLNDPTTWQNPLRAIASYNFQARSPQELSFSANQVLNIAPQSLQPHLWNSGWIMATADRKTAGLVPVNYIRIVVSKESEQNAPTEYSTELDLSNLSNESFESREPSTDKTNGRDS